MTTEKKLPLLRDVEDTMEDINYFVRDICIDYYNKGIQESQKGMIKIEDVEKMIEEIEFTNIVRMNSNLGANITQDKIKELLKQSLRKKCPTGTKKSKSGKTYRRKTTSKRIRR
jgi:hypothetical protein